jgi:hypothetical protein
MGDEKLEFHRSYSSFIPHPSSFLGRRSQVVRQRSAKPLFIGSIPIAASNNNLNSMTTVAPVLMVHTPRSVQKKGSKCAKPLGEKQ